MKKILCAVLSIFLLAGLTACSDQTSSQSDDAPTWESLYEKGLNLLKKGEYADAAESFTRAIELDSSRAALYEGRGDAYEKLEEYEKAAADYRKLVELNSSAGSYQRLADCYRLMKDKDREADALREAYAATGNHSFSAALRELWDKSAMKRYADYLAGTGKDTGFALAELTGDRVPELIAGPVSDVSGIVTVLDSYTVYTVSGGTVSSLWSGDVDDRYYPDVAAAGGSRLLTRSHGTGGYTASHYVLWQNGGTEKTDLVKCESGEAAAFQLETNETYNVTEDGVVWGYFKDRKQISKKDYTALTDQLEKTVDKITFHPNTQKMRATYLGAEGTAAPAASDGASGLSDEAFLKSVHANFTALNELAAETFGAQADTGKSYLRVYASEADALAGKAPVRLVPSGTAVTGGTADPGAAALYPVKNDRSLQDVRDYMSRYLRQELYENAMRENFCEFDGTLYLVRGGRGYGTETYQESSARVSGHTGSTWRVTVKRNLLDRFDKVVTLTFQTGGSGYLLTEISE